MKKSIEAKDAQLQELEKIHKDEFGLVEQNSLMTQLQDQQE